jgi:hypothetical protein
VKQHQIGERPVVLPQGSQFEGNSLLGSAKGRMFIGMLNDQSNRIISFNPYSVRVISNNLSYTIKKAGHQISEEAIWCKVIPPQ